MAHIQASRPDMDIEADVEDIIVHYPPLMNDRHHLNVHVEDGAVTVTGHTRSAITREYLVDAVNKIARYFGMTIDELVNFDGNIPDEVTIEDKSLMEQVKLIAELEPEEKNMVFKMIDTFLTKKKFKDFFQKNVAAL